MKRTRVLILGAGGRDFHNFNRVFRDDATVEVVAFTATQIPYLAGRTYPPELAGPLYPHGIPILAEDTLARLVVDQKVDEVVFAYSDVSHDQVMHAAERALALGASFRLLGARATWLKSGKPVVSVTAVRTGCGKSPVARRLAALLKAAGLRVAILRHPMAYGDLAAMAVQRFAAAEDLERAAVTLEEREEYEPHLAAGNVVYAGVDYARVLAEAEAEADVILWDGGNNDLPLIEPDLDITLVDPHRPGHEHAYFPGEANLLRAHVIVIPKVDSAAPAALEAVRASVHEANPRATVIECALVAQADHPERIPGRRVLVVEDGPTLTHGGMAHGAGLITARALGAAVVVDPRPFAVGSIAETFARYPHIGPVLPALGYAATQRAELAATIAAVPCDVVVVASPVDLARVMPLRQPVCRVRYEAVERGTPNFAQVLAPLIERVKSPR